MSVCLVGLGWPNRWEWPDTLYKIFFLIKYEPLKTLSVSTLFLTDTRGDLYPIKKCIKGNFSELSDSLLTYAIVTDAFAFVLMCFLSILGDS